MLVAFIIIAIVAGVELITIFYLLDEVEELRENALVAKTYLKEM